MASQNEFSNSAEETFEIGKKIASKLLPGSVVALNGDLGSGKTALTKGIAAGLGIEDMITSPTYTIINQYEFSHELHAGSRMAAIESFLSCKTRRGLHELRECNYFYHIDVYRLNSEKEFEEIGGEEILSSNGICIIEWADKIKKLLPENTIFINIEITGTDCRKIKIEGLNL